MNIVSTRLYFFALVGFLMLNGFDCGDGCGTEPTEDPAHIWETSDGGVTWKSYASTPSRILQGINFLGPDALVAVGTGGNIYRTTDGGGDWHAVHSGTTSELYEIIALKAFGHGIITGSDGTILRSSDGGQNWITIELPDNTVNPISIAFAEDDLHGVTVANSAAGGIYGTTDGGVTWQRLSSTESPTDVVALSESEWLFCKPGTHLRRSTDGGRTLVDVPDSTSAMFANPTTLQYLELVSGQTVLAMDQANRIYKSTDGGTSWVEKSSGLTGSDKINDFHYSNGLCIGVGNNSRVTLSNDEGETWTVPTGIAREGMMRAAHFIDSQFGYIVGD
jgi:photosystem II stability/assembly factor-like uncharacterized protein